MSEGSQSQYGEALCQSDGSQFDCTLYILFTVGVYVWAIVRAFWAAQIFRKNLFVLVVAEQILRNVFLIILIAFAFGQSGNGDSELLSTLQFPLFVSIIFDVYTILLWPIVVSANAVRATGVLPSMVFLSSRFAVVTPLGGLFSLTMTAVSMVRLSALACSPIVPHKNTDKDHDQLPEKGKSRPVQRKDFFYQALALSIHGLVLLTWLPFIYISQFVVVFAGWAGQLISDVIGPVRVGDGTASTYTYVVVIIVLIKVYGDLFSICCVPRLGMCSIISDLPLKPLKAFKSRFGDLPTSLQGLESLEKVINGAAVVLSSLANLYQFLGALTLAGCLCRPAWRWVEGRVVKAIGGGWDSLTAESDSDSTDEEEEADTSPRKKKRKAKKAKKKLSTTAIIVSCLVSNKFLLQCCGGPMVVNTACELVNPPRPWGKPNDKKKEIAAKFFQV